MAGLPTPPQVPYQLPSPGQAPNGWVATPQHHNAHLPPAAHGRNFFIHQYLTLRYDANGSIAMPVIDYDFSVKRLKPEDGLYFTNPRQHKGEAWATVLAQPASNPPVTTKLIIQIPGLDLHVCIFPLMNQKYVTVGDVLYGLYRELRMHIAPDQYSRLSPQERPEIDAAYKLRVKEDHSEAAQGIRRVDFLKRARKLLGFVPEQSNVWVLRTGE